MVDLSQISEVRECDIHTCNRLLQNNWKLISTYTKVITPEPSNHLATYYVVGRPSGISYTFEQAMR